MAEGEHPNGMVIGVTGTPAAGKSDFAKKLGEALPSSMVVELNGIVEAQGIYSSIDDDGSKVVVLDALEKAIEKAISDSNGKNLIITGHLAQEIVIKYDMIVVIRAHLKDLIERMEARGYPEGKIRENLVSESVDYCGVKSMEMCDETYEVCTDAEKAGMISYIISIASGKQAPKPDKNEISRLDELLELATGKNKYGL